MLLRMLYILAPMCLIPPPVPPTPAVTFPLISPPTMKGPKSLRVTLPGRLYRRTPTLGLMMTIEWLEQLICPLSKPRWKWFRPFPSTLDRDPRGWPFGFAIGWLWWLPLTRVLMVLRSTCPLPWITTLGVFSLRRWSKWPPWPTIW